MENSRQDGGRYDQVRISSISLFIVDLRLVRLGHVGRVRLGDGDGYIFIVMKGDWERCKGRLGYGMVLMEHLSCHSCMLDC